MQPIFFIWLIWKRLCVCQVSTEGTGSRGQTGHSDNGQMYADFTDTSANYYSCLAHPNLVRCRHFRVHYEYKFACAHCQRSYVSKGGLRKLTKYRCETCGKGFFDRCLYQYHIAAHTGFKRHTCSSCEMKFTYKTSLRAHVLHIHPNETVLIV